VAKFKYLAMTVANQNLIEEEIRGYWIPVMLAIIEYRIFCLLICCLKT
jgi:hypothetical protein